MITTLNSIDNVPTQYMGLSTDTKPIDNVSINSLFLELDTKDIYYFDGSAWSKVGGE